MGQACLSGPSLVSPQREPPWEEGLPSKELADGEGNVPGNGRRECSDSKREGRSSEGNH